MDNSKEMAQRIIDKMDRSTRALEALSKHEDKKQREASPALIQRDRAAIAAQRSAEARFPSAHTALQTADAAHSVYKLARHGSLTGGIADLAAAGLKSVGLHKAGDAARQVGSAAAIAEALGGNVFSAPRAIEGLPDLVKGPLPLGPFGAAGLAYKAAKGGLGMVKGAYNAVDDFSRPNGKTDIADETAAALASRRGEAQILHASRVAGHAARGAGSVAGGVAGAVLGAGAGPLGMLAGGYLGSKAGGMGAGLAYQGLVAPGEWALKATANLRDFADNLKKTNFQFAEFSAGMTRVQVEQELRDMAMSKESGDKRSKTAKLMAEQTSETEKTMRGVEDVGANVSNLGTAAKANILNRFTNPTLGGLVPEGVTRTTTNWANEKLGNMADFFDGKDEASKPITYDQWGKPQRFYGKN